MFLWVADFWCLTPGSANPNSFKSLSPLGTMFDHNWRAFHLRGYLSLLSIPNTHIFHFLFLLCNRETHFGRCPILPSPPSNAKHSVDLPCTHDILSNTKHSVDLPTMHSHPFNAMSLCICNARCHCMLYHVTCIMNATWTTQSTLLTSVMDNYITCIGLP